MKLLVLSVLAAIAVAGSVYQMTKKTSGDVVYPTPVYDTWVHWKQHNARSYGTDNEESYRLAVFYENYKFVMAHTGDDATWEMGLNQFADVTKEEFAAKHMGLNAAEYVHTPNVEMNINDAPASYDWTTKGAVTPVKNQAQCGSCWAFATVANIEGARVVQAKKALGSYSEQQLVDCDKTTGDQGCNGGLPSNAYKDMIAAKFGLETEADYPYSGADSKCKAVAGKEVAFISNWVQVSTNEDEIAAALVKYGPLSIGINATWMQFYMGGVAKPLSFLCNPKSLDHGVTIVGYGEDNGTKFWKIKNSWGASWGEKGYYRIIRGDGRCGVNQMVTSAVVSA